ncbi:MAG: tyrosine-type recombinase/integrase [Methylocystis sp.]|uniref:tyrosine-type recombinase/integrase n=1 Tax=Methylocystis sp. TaxID=1911079 RepID=UPI003DA57CF5
MATAPPGTYCDGGGLYLIVSEFGSRSWVYRFSFGDRRPEMGLGTVEEGVGLAEARAARDEARAIRRSGRNPIEAREAARRASATKKTFGEVADELLESKASSWKHPKHVHQWKVSLKESAASLRSRPVDEIDTEAVVDVLKPIWLEKPAPASRLRQRIEAVLDAAKAKGLRSGENPARWRGHLSHLLPERPRLVKGHHTALPYAELPSLFLRLQEVETTSAHALRFCILTATRSAEVYGAAWGEIDINERIWTIPSARMKTAREHRVPLSDAALAVINAVKPIRVGDYVFPGQRRAKPLSHVAMAKVLERLGVAATVHGFRSAFRDWAGNETHFPREIAEAALAHSVGDETERAYRRSDALEKRRALMEAWANYCGSGN